MSTLGEQLVEELSERFSIYHGLFANLIEDEDFVDIMNWFHISYVFHVTRNDAEFCGIRANNFCVKIGREDGGGKHGLDELIIIVEGNHKGNLAVDVISVPYGKRRLIKWESVLF